MSLYYFAADGNYGDGKKLAWVNTDLWTAENWFTTHYEPLGGDDE